MMAQYERFNASILGVQTVKDEETSRYGIVDGSKIEDRFYNVDHVIEKPALGEAPSNLAILGRYILSPKIFDILENLAHGANDEIHLSDAISVLIDNEDVYVYD